MTPRVRLAVVGVGHLGRHHVRIASSLPSVDFVAAVDSDLSRARAAVAPFGGDAFEDSAQVIDRVDAVTIAVPTAAHLSVARPFLERGIHVLVEKPMAASLEEADEMIALAERSGATLAVGHSERFNPAIATALGLVDAPRFIEGHRLSGFPERSLDIDVVFDVMIHDLDIILTAAKSEVVGVEAIGVPVMSPKVDIANARVTFASGCIANLTASRISRDKVRKIRFFQRDMYLSVDCATQEVETWRVRPRPGERPAIEGGAVPVGDVEPLVAEIGDFVAAIVERRAPAVPGADGRRALALATRVAEAMKDDSGA